MSTLNVNGRGHTVDADPGWRGVAPLEDLDTRCAEPGNGRAELARRSNAPLVNSANRTCNERPLRSKLGSGLMRLVVAASVSTQPGQEAAAFQ